MTFDGSLGISDVVPLFRPAQLSEQGALGTLPGGVGRYLGRYE